MDEDLKKQIDLKQGSNGFIKVTEEPVRGLSDQQKVFLNRKANVLFNQGNISQAERIYLTTGYSDGLSRVGDKYAEKQDYMNALRLYLLAHNKRKSEPIIEKLAGIVSVMLK